jgi:predicted amidophosphoribosyltransferase
MTTKEIPREVIWCPHCGNDIFSDTLICWHCHKPVEEVDPDYGWDDYDPNYDSDYDHNEEEVG